MNQAFGNRVTIAMKTPNSTLFFDGRCPLCGFEIAHLKRLSRGGLDFVDIHQYPADGLADMPPRQVLLGVLHLRTAEGKWLRGMDASVAAWQTTRLGVLLVWLRWPLIAPLADRFYIWWANRRYQRYYGQRECKPRSRDR